MTGHKCNKTDHTSVWACHLAVQCPLTAHLVSHVGAAHAQMLLAIRNSARPCCIALHCPIGCLACVSHWASVQVQVIIATAPTCWGMSIAAHLVVIMGTQYYDGAHSQGADDYPVTDLLQMMGRASRPDIDDSGKWVVLRSPASPHLNPPCCCRPVLVYLANYSMASAAIPAAKAGLCAWTYCIVPAALVPLLFVLMHPHGILLLFQLSGSNCVYTHAHTHTHQSTITPLPSLGPFPMTSLHPLDDPMVTAACCKPAAANVASASDFS